MFHRLSVGARSMAPDPGCNVRQRAAPYTCPRTPVALASGGWDPAALAFTFQLGFGQHRKKLGSSGRNVRNPEARIKPSSAGLMSARGDSLVFHATPTLNLFPAKGFPYRLGQAAKRCGAAERQGSFGPSDRADTTQTRRGKCCPIGGNRGSARSKMHGRPV